MPAPDETRWRTRALVLGGVLVLVGAAIFYILYECVKALPFVTEYEGASGAHLLQSGNGGEGASYIEQYATSAGAKSWAAKAVVWYVGDLSSEIESGLQNNSYVHNLLNPPQSLV